MWKRYRFYVNGEDPRPVTFPPPGPYWVSDYEDGGEERAIIVAYITQEAEICSYWPDAEEITHLDNVATLQFTRRFPRPDWWSDICPA